MHNPVNERLSLVSKVFKEANKQRLSHEWDCFFAQENQNRPIDFFIASFNRNYSDHTSSERIKLLYRYVSDVASDNLKEKHFPNVIPVKSAQEVISSLEKGAETENAKNKIEQLKIMSSGQLL